MERLKDRLAPESDRVGDGSTVTIKVTASVMLGGELDCSTEREVTCRIARLVESSDEILIDTRQIEFIDAAGVRTLLLAKRKALQQGATLTVEVTSAGPVARLLGITGLRECLT
jgi:anti-anti-sigma factor